MGQNTYGEAEELTIKDMIPSRTTTSTLDSVNDLLMFWDASENKAYAATVGDIVSAATLTSDFTSGDIILAAQNTVPTGWTRVTGSAYDEAVFQLLASSPIPAPTTGGSVSFGSVHTTFTVPMSSSTTSPSAPTNMSITPHPLSAPEIPNHTHNLEIGVTLNTSPESGEAAVYTTKTPFTPTGYALGTYDTPAVTFKFDTSGSGVAHPHSITTSHTHTFSWSPTPTNFNIDYVEVMIITKD